MIQRLVGAMGLVLVGYSDFHMALWTGYILKAHFSAIETTKLSQLE